jgi:hypothetical protein
VTTSPEDDFFTQATLVSAGVLDPFPPAALALAQKRLDAIQRAAQGFETGMEDWHVAELHAVRLPDYAAYLARHGGTGEERARLLTMARWVLGADENWTEKELLALITEPDHERRLSLARQSWRSPPADEPAWHGRLEEGLGLEEGIIHELGTEDAGDAA